MGTTIFSAVAPLGRGRRTPRHFGRPLSRKLFGFYTMGEIGGADEGNNYIAIGIEHDF